jgi:tRNA threonylcarbamoyl adenosine modification protein YeaZ
MTHLLPALIIHHSTTDLFIAFASEERVLSFVTVPYRAASQELIPAIADLLSQHNTTLAALSFIACNHGPGAFTTLRSIVVTINGLSFAKKIPLISINGSLALAEEAHLPQYNCTYALLNAFCHEIYYATYGGESPPALGTVLFTDWLKQLQETHNPTLSTIQFVGSGAELYRTELELAYGPLSPTMMQHASLDFVTRKAYRLWHAGNATLDAIVPYYGRTASGYLPHTQRT